MWILLVPVVVAEIVFWAVIVYLAWRALKAARNRNWPKVAAFSAVISIPFAGYFVMQQLADARESARASEVAALITAAPPQTFPKLLEVYGHATEFELLIFLDVLTFEEVIVFQRPKRSELRGRFVTLASGCEGVGVAHLKAWKARRRFGAPTQADKDCLVSEWKTVASDRAKIPALEYRHGTHSTLLPSGNNWANGAYEVRLRMPDDSRLLAYWERPYITRPASPGPWGYAFPANTDWKKYKEPKRLDFLLESMGIQ